MPHVTEPKNSLASFESPRFGKATAWIGDSMLSKWADEGCIGLTGSQLHVRWEAPAAETHGWVFGERPGFNVREVFSRLTVEKIERLIEFTQSNHLGDPEDALL